MSLSFFAAIAILQFFSIFSTISPGLVILPLALRPGITALKDGYEDIKRHQSDRRVNSTAVRILEGGDFVNQNVTGKKSKTFVRGLVPRSLKKKPQVLKSGDIEMQQSAAPPEAINDQENPEETYDDGYEYDYPPDGAEDHEEDHHKRNIFHRKHHEYHPRWRRLDGKTSRLEISSKFTTTNRSPQTSSSVQPPRKKTWLSWRRKTWTERQISSLEVLARN
jgi:phospholipid-translocating ATPase